MIAFDLEKQPRGDRRGIVESWRSILGPGDFYCPHEDDVLLDSEVAAALGQS